jgi:peptide/nickel transport system substrate-binding protein
VVEGAPTASFDALIVHNQREPFSDRRFRLALNYATDKQQVVDAVLFGFGTPVETPVSPASPMFNKDLPRREQDIERAKALLAEVGYPDGIDLTVVAPAGRVNRERLALVLQEMWRPAGIRLRVERVPWDKFVADVELKADMYVSGWAGRATVDQMLQVAIHSTATYNLWHYQNPEVDRLIDEGRRATTPQEQARIYARMQQLLFDDPPGVVAYVLNDYTAYRRSVHNYRIHPLFGVMYLDDVWIQP